MLDFYTLLEYSQIKAIETAINPTADSIYRIKCREYSIRFHTPLDKVLNELDPIFVMQQLHEEQYTPRSANEEIEELLEILNKIKDPSYSKLNAQETEDLVDAVLNREIARAAKKKAPTQQAIQNEIKAAEAAPKSGGMQFPDLEQIDSEAEKDKQGF